MLSEYFDFKLASYSAPSDVKKSEALQADLVEIRGFVPGGIYHSNFMSWAGNIGEVTEVRQFLRSKKERKIVVENRAWFEQQGYEFRVKLMDKHLFEEFYELYQATTLKRERALNFAVRDQVLGRVLTDSPVYVVGMFHNKSLESGLVFTVSGEVASVSFGAKKKFERKSGGVGGVLELLLMEYCKEHHVTEISHGKTKNPAGITGKAGIFEFKARYGFSAFPMGYWKTTFILNPKVALSDLVFVSMIDNTVGYVVVSDGDPIEIAKKYQTKEVKLIKQLSMKQARDQARTFIASIQ